MLGYVPLMGRFLSQAGQGPAVSRHDTVTLKVVSVNMKERSEQKTSNQASLDRTRARQDGLARGLALPAECVS